MKAINATLKVHLIDLVVCMRLKTKIEAKIKQEAFNIYSPLSRHFGIQVVRLQVVCRLTKGKKITLMFKKLRHKQYEEHNDGPFLGLYLNHKFSNLCGRLHLLHSNATGVRLFAVHRTSLLLRVQIFRCGSRIWSRGGPQLPRPKVADVAKRSRASEASH